jgi:response regulator RpfG family c-di-GMP phosphodiesterase
MSSSSRSRAAAESPDRAGVARRPRVLCVDDEPRVLESLRDSLRRRFEVVATTNGFEALRILAAQPCEAVLSDMRMPKLNGARFLTLAREHAPDTVRLLLTGQSTLDDAVSAVNEGEIFRFLIKPCPTRDLIAALDSAVERHRTLVRERDLGEQSLHGTIRALALVAAATDPAAPRRAERIRRHAMALAGATDAIIPSRELERACELAQVGAVAVSPETRSHLARERRLDRGHAAELERLPELAARLVGPIAWLAPVAAMLSAAGQSFEPTRPGLAGTPPAARVLRIVLDFDLLEIQGVSASSALQTMRNRAGRYDQTLLDIFAELQGADG